MMQYGNQDGGTGNYSIEWVYEQFHSPVVRFFLSKGLQQDAAEDLGQEVFYRVLRSGKALSDEAYTRNLVFCIAQNLLIDHFRKNHGPVQERTGVEDDVAAVHSTEFACYDSPEDAFISSETRGDVHAVLSKLPARHAQAIMLRELEGLSYREMAVKLGMSEKAAESLLHRARVQLKTELAHAGEQRGGWWSAFPITVVTIKKAIAGRIASVPKSIAARAASISASVSSIGLGQSFAAFLVSLILVGSAVGAGVAVAAYDNQGTRAPAVTRSASPTGASNTQVPVLQGLKASESKTTEARSSTPVVAPRVATEPGVTQGPLVPVSGIITSVVQDAGNGLELLTSGLGKTLNALTDPLLDIVGRLGLPSGISELLSDVVGLGMATDLEHVLLETGVATVGSIEASLQSLVPAGIPVAPAAAVASVSGQPATTTTSPQSSSNAQPANAPATDTTPATQVPPASKAPATQPQAPKKQAPATQPQGPVDQIVDPIVNPIVDVINQLLP